MKRGSYGGNPDPLTTADIVSWFANCRGAKPSEEACAEIARRLDGPPSPQWLAYSQDLESQQEGVPVSPEYWNFREVSAALKVLIAALPRVREHWERVADCDDALLARSALADLDKDLAASSTFIEYPFGEYARSHRKKPKEWHLAATIILRCVGDALAMVKKRRIKFSYNSPAVKITQLALERMGYGNVTLATIAKHAERWNSRFGNPMTTNED